MDAAVPLLQSEVDEALLVIGFKPTQSDPCIYPHGSGDTLVILAFYVAEILISGQDAKLVAQTKQELRTGDSILGTEVKRDYEEGTLTITLKRYVNNILERIWMQDSNPVSTPGYEPELSVDQPADTLLGATGAKLYSITGSLLYLSQCKRYICYAVNQLTGACNKLAV